MMPNYHKSEFHLAWNIFMRMFNLQGMDTELSHLKNDIIYMYLIRDGK